jgi:hypothetical protein
VPNITGRPEIKKLQLSNFVWIMSAKRVAGRTPKLATFGNTWIMYFPLSGIPFEFCLLPRFIQEKKMSKLLAVLVAFLFVAGSAFAQTPQGQAGAGGAGGTGAAGATGAAAGGMTAGMIAAAVAVAAVAVAASQTNDNNQTTTTVTTQ